MSPADALIESMEKLAALIAIYPDSMLGSTWSDLLLERGTDLVDAAD